MTKTAFITLGEIDDGIALMTLRRPDKLNALTWPMVDEILEALTAVASDRTIRALVLTGEGRGFCSGLDIGGEDAVGTNGGVVEVFDRQERIAALAVALRGMPQPAIAAVNGAAAGAGMALALACDVRVCSAAARFNVAFVRIGLSACDVGVSHLLPRIVGFGIASELMLTGRQVPAEEALRIGLANSVCESDELLDAAATIAQQMIRNSPFGLRMTKQVLQRNVDAPSLEAAIDLENRTQILATRTDDMTTALAAFKAGEERPRFNGR
jgi:enoyl-CoA hydratase